MKDFWRRVRFSKEVVPPYTQRNNEREGQKILAREKGKARSPNHGVDYVWDRCPSCGSNLQHGFLKRTSTVYTRCTAGKKGCGYGVFTKEEEQQ